MTKTIAVQLSLEDVANKLREQGYEVISLYDLEYSNQFVNAIVYSRQDEPTNATRQGFNSTGVTDYVFETVYIDAGQKDTEQIIEEVVATIGPPE